jgi:hypothetical protein
MSNLKKRFLSIARLAANAGSARLGGLLPAYGESSSNRSVHRHE